MDDLETEQAILSQWKKYDLLLENYTPNSKKEIVDLLELKIDDLRSTERMLELTESVYKRYIDYLSYAGLLIEKPFKNYLHSGQPRL